MSVAPGCVVPVPGFKTFDARPDAVFVASVGGFATSAGAALGSNFAWTKFLVASGAPRFVSLNVDVPDFVKK